MRVLSPASARRRAEGLATEVPRHVLEILGFRGGAREAQIVREVVRRLPSHVGVEAAADWVKQSLGYLIVRGDVERGPGGVYRCVPAYVVQGLSGAGGHVLRLHGDPRAERALLKALRDLGAVVESGAGTGHQVGHADEGPKPDLVALERRIVLAVADGGSAASACEAHGYPVFRISRLAEDLPNVDGLLCPAERDLRPAEGLPKGGWDVYDPGALSDEEDGEDRWRPREYRGAGVHGLVRLRERGEEPGEQKGRIFYHGGGGRVFHLDHESASLWMLYLDRLSGNPRTTVWHNGRLWAPGMIPFKTVRWLELLAGRRARRGGRRLSLPVDEAPAKEAQAVLERTLGLRALKRLPEKRRRSSGSRRGRQGR